MLHVQKELLAIGIFQMREVTKLGMPGMQGQTKCIGPGRCLGYSEHRCQQGQFLIQDKLLCSYLAKQLSLTE